MTGRLMLFLTTTDPTQSLAHINIRAHISHRTSTFVITFRIIHVFSYSHGHAAQPASTCQHFTGDFPCICGQVVTLDCVMVPGKM